MSEESTARKSPVFPCDELIAVLKLHITQAQTEMSTLPSEQDLLTQIAAAHVKMDGTSLLKVGEVMTTIKKSEALKGKIEGLTNFVSFVERSVEAWYAAQSE